MNVAYVVLGSNIQPEQNIVAAVRLLAQVCPIEAVSSVYETPPVGDTGQPDFLNAAVKLQTDLSAAALKTQVLQPIETALGRRRSENPNEARTIDLDIVLFNHAVIELDKGRIPDPDIEHQAYMAYPLADIAPGYVHPLSGLTLAAIAANLAAAPGIRRRDDIVLAQAAQ